MAGENVSDFVVDIDIGGTFTDTVVSVNNVARFFKVDTIAHELSQCLQNAFEKVIASYNIADLRTFLVRTRVIRLSTSLSTNILVERKGAQCGLIVTRGMSVRYLSQYAASGAPVPLVFENMVAEIDADHDSVCDDLEDQVRERVRLLVERGAATIIVSLSGTEFSTDREYQVKEIISKYYPRHFMGSVPVLLGAQVSSSADFLERTNMAVLNAYCRPSMASRFLKIEEFLRVNGHTHPLLVVNSSGASARVAKTKAIHTIDSGSTAGIFGIHRLIRGFRLNNVVSVDIGGTTTEIGLLVDRKIKRAEPSILEGLPVDLSRPLIATLGIGGGSVAHLDPNGDLAIGPHSTGAFPGPACYNLGGTDPTLTDAYLVLGYLDHNYFLGGQKTLNKGAAQKAIENKLALSLGLSCYDVALAIVQKAAQRIEVTIRKLLQKVNLIPSEVSLAAIGGGGGCMAAMLANFMSFPETYVFRQGAVFGAYGTGGMDVVHTYEIRLDLSGFFDTNCWEENCRELNSSVADLQRNACNDMLGEGFTPGDVHFELEIELYNPVSGSPFKIATPHPFVWPGKDRELMLRLAHEKIGDVGNSKFSKIRLSRLFLSARAGVPHSNIVSPRLDSRSPNPHKHPRKIYVGQDTWQESRVCEWDFLSTPATLLGPVILESADTTIVIPQGMVIELDELYNGIIRKCKNES
ncbi:MAG: hydantoinase/oxoprolinase family protein [Pseudomonadota bacterium]